MSRLTPLWCPVAEVVSRQEPPGRKSVEFSCGNPDRRTAEFDDTRRSLVAGNREVTPALSCSVCDALLVPTPAELPYVINRYGLSKVLFVSAREVLIAIRLRQERYHDCLRRQH